MNQTQTVGRALDILFALAEEDQPLTVKEISEKVAIPTSTVYRLVKTLEMNEVVAREQNGGIELGMKLFTLAQKLNGKVENDLLEMSLPVLKGLTETLQETAFIAVKKGRSGVTLQSVEVDRLIRFVTKKGKLHPFTEGATGKAILAFEREEVQKEMLASFSDAEQQSLATELETIRRNGYVMTVGEVDADTLAIAAPIFHTKHEVVASLNIAGPRMRFEQETVEQAVKQVKDAAAALTDALQAYNKKY